LLYARRKGWPVDRVEARVRHERVDAGQGAGKSDVISVELLLGGNLTSEQEARLRQVADRCPVHRALTGQVTITRA
jgi:putative redox protein